MGTSAKRGSLGSMSLVTAAVNNKTAEVIVGSVAAGILMVGCGSAPAETAEYPTYCVSPEGDVLDDDACDGDDADRSNIIFIDTSGSSSRYARGTRIPSSVAGDRVGATDTAARTARGIPQGRVSAGATVRGNVGGGSTAGVSSGG